VRMKETENKNSDFTERKGKNSGTTREAETKGHTADGDDKRSISLPTDGATDRGGFLTPGFLSFLLRDSMATGRMGGVWTGERTPGAP